jgi:hypothetical protein
VALSRPRIIEASPARGGPRQLLADAFDRRMMLVIHSPEFHGVSLYRVEEAVMLPLVVPLDNSPTGRVVSAAGGRVST